MNRFQAVCLKSVHADRRLRHTEKARRVEKKGEQMGKNVRAHVIITGRVQGVFFRDETRRAAKKIGVSGWVRNAPDGTVEAVFEGEAAAVDEAIAWCHKGSPLSSVSEVKVVSKDWAGDMEDFTIRY